MRLSLYSIREAADEKQGKESLFDQTWAQFFIPQTECLDAIRSVVRCLIHPEDHRISPPDLYQ